LTRLLVAGIAADTAASIHWDIIARAMLALVYHRGHLWWPSRRKFWRFGGHSGVGRAQNSRFLGAHLQGSVSGGKCFAAAAKQLPPVNSSTSRFLQREIIFFKGYSNFLCGGPKVPLPAHNFTVLKLKTKQKIPRDFQEKPGNLAILFVRTLDFGS
jgi:hypothetical protein